MVFQKNKTFSNKQIFLFFFIRSCKLNRKINLFLSFVLLSLGHNLAKNTMELIKHYTSALYRHHSKLCSAICFFSPLPWRIFFQIIAVNFLWTLDSKANSKCKNFLINCHESIFLTFLKSLDVILRPMIFNTTVHMAMILTIKWW